MCHHDSCCVKSCCWVKLFVVWSVSWCGVRDDVPDADKKPTCSSKAARAHYNSEALSAGVLASNEGVPCARLLCR